ncbi:MAG: metal-dependent hydrolase [Candidatus Micrarchaeota archaeon]
MPNRNEHIVLGCLLAGGAYLLFKRVVNEKPTWGGLITSVAAGGAIGLLPDLLEPATNPTHRNFFHSALALGTGTYGTYKVLQNPLLNQNQKQFLLALFAGYASHLLADATTARSIPLLGVGEGYGEY